MYDRVQKSSSSWNPSPTQKKKSSKYGPRTFSVQPRRQTKFAEQKEKPTYSRVAADKFYAKVLGTMENGTQRLGEAQAVQRPSEQGAAPVEEAATVQEQAQEIEIQRQCKECREEEKDSDEMSSLGVQAKLTVGAPDDKYEQEADRVALQVMAMPDSATKPQSIQRQSQEDETLHKQPLADSITSVVQPSEDEEDVQTKPSVQRAVNSGANDADSSLESRLSASKSGGSPLTPQVRAFMEPRFGNDFSAVRIHTGSTAVQMNKELHAQAFTHGKDIYFNEGKYNPESDEGKQLLAHELTHVVQQTGRVQPKKELRLKPTAANGEKSSVSGYKGNKIKTKATPVAAGVTLDSSLGIAVQIQALAEPGKTIEQPKNTPLANLVAAAKQMPGHFMGQLYEEVLGMNLTQPLPFERSQEDCAKCNMKATAKGGEATAKGGDKKAALLNKTQFTEEDFAVDQVVPFDVNPELIASLNLKNGGEVEFGSSNDPANSISAIKAELAGGEPSGKATAGAAPGGEKAGGECCDDEQTAEAKLQGMMAQKPEGAEATQKQGKPAQPGDIPANMKTIGPLSVGQRAKYMSHQMIQGVKQWFSANWPKLLAGAIAALAAFIALNIFTGGAITAALPALMQVVGGVMGGVALANIAGHIGNYLSQGWAGNIAGAAKSLARGLAAGAVELVFALLFNAGAVIKALKGGLKGTALAAAEAANNTVKTTVKSVKELGQIGAKGAKAAIKNGKIMLQGVKRGFAKGAKSLDDLARQLVGKLRFNKFKIRLQGRRIQLLGHINPWVLLADGTVKEVSDAELASTKFVAQLDPKMAKLLTQPSNRFPEALLANQGAVDSLLQNRNVLETVLKKAPGEGREILTDLLTKHGGAAVQVIEDLAKDRRTFKVFLEKSTQAGGEVLTQLFMKRGETAVQAISQLKEQGFDVLEILQKYQKIINSNVPQADRLLGNLASGKTKTKGAVGEIKHIEALLDRGSTIERVADQMRGIDGQMKDAADIILKDGKVIDVKYYDWDKGPLRIPKLRQKILDDMVNDMIEQVKLRKKQYPGAPIEYAFKPPLEKIPIEIVDALTKLGVKIVEGTP